MADLTAVFVVVMINVMATLAMGAAEAPNPPHPTKSNPDPTRHIQ